MELSFDTSGLSAEGINRFSETHSVLKNLFDIKATGHIDFHLEQFEIFKHCLEINIRGSYVIRHANNDCYILFIETHSADTHTRKGKVVDHYDSQVWALAYLKHNFGRVKIRPETLADKILELVHPIELDFAEDKAFSDTFYVLIDDYAKAVAAIGRNFRNAVMDVRADDFVIEIVEHTLIIGSRKPVTPEKAVHLAEFVARLCALC